MRFIQFEIRFDKGVPLIVYEYTLYIFQVITCCGCHREVAEVAPEAAIGTLSDDIS